ncbi:MAG: hypothetical protein MK101_05885 [Phycisphaerales bacterium]|nr:hypothetical protein [Phycisphaerales bacterium]
MCESLWMDERREEWFAGGMEEPGIHSICVDPRDGTNVSIAVSCGGVWHTQDDGQTWELACTGMRAAYLPKELEFSENVQDPHIMVRCPANPDRLWVQHHNAVFRSDDGGRSWAELTSAIPSGFGFAVASHPHDPDTAWFIPAVSDEERIPVDGRMVVSMTRDAGKSFQIMDDGLPDSSWDLVFRHALDVSGDGTVLAFGSTTGNLFVSEDSGKTWSCVHRHLPPIHAVEVI